MKYFLWFISILFIHTQQGVAQNVEDRLGKSMHLEMNSAIYLQKLTQLAMKEMRRSWN